LWLIVFFVAGYFIWLKEFGYYRYLCPLELLAPILILLGTRQLFRGDRVISLVFIGLMVAVGAYMNFNTETGRGTWDTPDYFNVQLPEMARQPDIMVLMTSGKPMGFVVPFFPNDARFVRLQGNFDYTRSHLFLQTQLQTAREHQGPYLLMTPPGHIEASRKLLDFWGFRVATETCSPIHSGTPERISVCRVYGK